MVLEGPGGLLNVWALYKDGKAERIFVRNLPSFADQIGVPPEVLGMGRIIVDIAYGGIALSSLMWPRWGLKL